MNPIRGIHHITAMCGDPQQNVDFYAGVLGLSLVKVTVNYDDPGTYHLYYGDASASPGTILTFFPWPGAPRGRSGVGQVGVTAFAVPPGSLGFWAARLDAAGAATVVEERFGERALCFADPDELSLEIVEAAWAISPVAGPLSGDVAIRGFHSATLWLAGFERSAEVLSESLGLQARESEENRFRYGFGDEPGQAIDLLCLPGRQRGRTGAGAVHHIAFRLRDDADQSDWRTRVAAAGLDVTRVLDRTYFHSIYFREPGGVLYEMATDAPGFAVNEPAGSLGTNLMLPSWLEPSRDRLRAILPAFETREGRRFP